MRAIEVLELDLQKQIKTRDTYESEVSSMIRKAKEYQAKLDEMNSEIADTEDVIKRAKQRLAGGNDE